MCEGSKFVYGKTEAMVRGICYRVIKFFFFVLASSNPVRFSLSARSISVVVGRYREKYVIFCLENIAYTIFLERTRVTVMHAPDPVFVVLASQVQSSMRKVSGDGYRYLRP